MTGPAHGHRDPGPVDCVIVTSSDTRTAATDESGRTARELLERAGHRVRAQRIVPDDPAVLRAALEEIAADPAIRAVVINGGTGVSPRDRTYEVVTAFIERPLPGFGEIFRALSFQEVGAAAILSRAAAGTRGRLAVFAVPGSPAAVRLAVERLIAPQLAHLAGQLDLG